AQGQPPPLGEKVLVVGCGNVAMDAARQDNLAIEGGRIKVDQPSMATSLPGVFASGLFLAGEIFTGPTLAVAAAASGRRAAAAMDHFLRTGRHLTFPDECPRPVSRYPKEQASRICRVPSRPLQERPVEEPGVASIADGGPK
ncbi:MAG: hypothetical protein NTW80_08790, partial [Deltaproteobacteria bacterium]|nr:hypothetical protein [Deltaproteobacteria bacterium]